MKRSSISYRGIKCPVFIAVFFVITVLFVCSVYPMAFPTNPSVVSLQATFGTNPPVNSIVSEQPVLSDTIQEQRLISLLMQDRVISDPSAPRPGWRRVHMRVTGYCPCSQCCGAFSDGITANNHRIQAGDKFAAADESYPFGTEIVVPGYNTGNAVQVLDRGGAIKGNRLDLFFHTHQEALEWGVQYLGVLVKMN